MNLYLHIGTEKTGSSYMQTIFGKSRPYLEENGIFFPSAYEREEDMLKGRISPGNAKWVHESLKAKNYTKLEKELAKVISEAKGKKCHSILLSNESIISSFSDSELSFFFKAVRNAGIEQTKAILLVRDPVDHAISMYKHRNKSGKHTDFGLWLNNEYKTLDYLNNFLSHYKQYPFECVIRKYQQDGEYLLKIFFDEWLKISPENFDEADNVNESLTFHEIHLLQMINKRYSFELASIVSKKLAGIPRIDKANDQELSLKYKAIAGKLLLKKVHIVDNINKYLPKDQRLESPLDSQSNEEIDLSNNLIHFSLSEAQANELATIFEYLNSPQGKLRLLKRKLAKFLPMQIKAVYRSQRN